MEHPRFLGRTILRYLQFFWVSALLVSGLIQEVLAGGSVTLDASSYLRTSSEQVNFGSTLVMNPVLVGEGKWVRGEIDVQANVMVPSFGTVTFESKQAYVETQNTLLPGHSFTLGRRIFDWSKADDVWKHGLWVPRFNWDALNPMPIGLTGFFYQYKQPGFRLLVHASPIAVPERGTPLSIVNGQFVSESRDNPVLPAGMKFSSTASFPTRYSIDMPGFSQILLRPSGAIQARFGEGVGAWASLQYGFMPVHQAEVPISSKVTPDPVLDVQLHPQFWNHHLLTAESGYNGGPWDFWMSLTREYPVPTELPVGYFTSALGPTFIGVWGASMKWRGGFQVNASMIGVFEDERPRGSPAPEGLTLMDRYYFRRALKFGAKWAAGSPIQYEVNLIHDILNSSSLLSFDLTVRNLSYLSSGEGLVFGLGTDIIVSGTGAGTIGQYEGNDRIRAKVTYAF